MSAATAISSPERSLAGAAACALPRSGDAGGIGGPGAPGRPRGRAAARAPRSAARGARSLELAPGAARAGNDCTDSKKETRS